MGKVVVVGSANVDLVVPVHHLPEAGETVLGGPLAEYFGGKGANQAVAARRAGAEVALVAQFGRDYFGTRYREYLKQADIDLSASTTTSDAATGVALITVDKGGQNQIAVASGANAALKVPHIYAAAKVIRWADVLLTQLEIPLASVEAALRAAMDRGAKTILNPAPAPAKRLPKRLLGYVDLLTPNEVEASRLSGRPTKSLKDVRRAAEALIKMGCRAVCVTMGEKGAMLVDSEGAHRFEAFKVRPVDTTACGDAFSGALAAAWAEGRPLREAVLWGSAAGALAAKVRGAQPSLPTEKAIGKLLARTSPKKKKKKK